MRLRTLLFYTSLFLMLGGVLATSAQELCEVLALEALNQVETNCAAGATEDACYGHASARATFNAEVDRGTFRRPSDFVDLLLLHTVRTTELNLEEDEWGLAYFQVQPESVNGQVKVLMAGDVVLENAVEDDSGTFAPMQAFNFTTGGETICQDAPNAILLQSPSESEVELTVNGTVIRMGSTVVLGTDVDEAGEDIMWLAVPEGFAIINPDTEEAVSVPQGNYTTAVLSDENGDTPNGDNVLNTQRVPVVDKVTGEPILGPNGEPFFRQIPVFEFTEPAEITEDGEGFAGWGVYAFINDVPDSLLNYPVEVPEVGEEAEQAAPPPPPQPVETPEPTPEPVVDSCLENWCLPGGKWEGTCDSDWHWQSGWYHAQLECGLISSIPDQFLTQAERDALTGGRPAPVATEEVSTIFSATITKCVTGGSGYDLTIFFTAVPADTAYFLIYPDPDSGLTNYVESVSNPLVTNVNTNYLPLSQIVAVDAGYNPLAETWVDQTATCP